MGFFDCFMLNQIIAMFLYIEMLIKIGALNLSSRTAFCEGSAFSWHEGNNKTADPSRDEAGFGMTVF
jgi:hypothetical protein